jgi:hypothetical protein
VVHDNRLEILSFTHDYFLNQNEKRVGYRFLPSTTLHVDLS